MILWMVPKLSVNYVKKKDYPNKILKTSHKTFDKSIKDKTKNSKKECSNRTF